MLPRTILLKKKAFRHLIVFMLCLAKACLEYTSLKGLAALLSKGGMNESVTTTLPFAFLHHGLFIKREHHPHSALAFLWRLK